MKCDSDFRPVVTKLPQDRACSLKQHFRPGVLREVAGILDLWAANDPEGFVWPRLAAITARCKRWTKPPDGKTWAQAIAEVGGKPEDTPEARARYTQRMVEYALKWLRDHHIISARLTRIRDGQKRDGFIVYPHDAISSRSLKAISDDEVVPGSTCTMIRPLRKHTTVTSPLGWKTNRRRRG